MGHPLAFNADLAGQSVHLDAVAPQHLQVVVRLCFHSSAPMTLVVLAFLLQLLDALPHQVEGVLELTG